jgi:thymidylate synthase
MKQYLEELQYILDNGETKTDRTGVGTIEVFGRQQRYNLKEGFPAVTTKKLAWKAVVSELLWFLEGSNDERRLAEILHGTRDTSKSTIWTANSNTQGKGLGYLHDELGPIYGYNWRYMYNNEYYPVKKRTCVNTPFSLPTTDEPVEISDNINVGKTFTNRFRQQYIVLGVHDNKYKIQYLKTKSVYHNVIEVGDNNNHRDGFEPTVHDVGMLGYYFSESETPITRKLKEAWYDLMWQYNYNKVDICDRWFVLSNFIEDAPKLDGWIWFTRLNNVVLERNYYGTTNMYCPETTVFVPKEHSTQYNTDDNPIMVRHPTLPTRFFPNVKEYKKTSPIGNVTKYDNDDFVIRHQFPVDQLKNLIDEIKTNPFSRRLLLTTLDMGSVDKAALTPCHLLAQFNVNQQNELSCVLFQRSCDYPLGSPFNIASYSLLTHMIAHVCDLQVGDFVYTTGSTHIYLNQVDGVKTQLQRKPLPLPKLWLNPNIKNIDEFTMEDIKLLDYTHHEPIVFPFAV